MAELDGEELTEEDLLSTLSLVVSSAGALNQEFGFCSLPVDSGSRIQLAAVGLVEGRLLVAVPRTAWHKKVANRVLPPTALQKPCLVEVDAVYLQDRLAEPTMTMRVWMGFLDHGLLLSLEEDAEPDSFDFGFHQADAEPMAPTAVALRDAAQEHFAFVSAVEYPEGEAMVSGLDMDPRVGRLEQLMEGLATSVSTLVSRLEPASSQATHLAATPKRASAMKIAGVKAHEGSHVSFAEKFPMMDPTVVTAALQAGVEEESLREMQKLLGAVAPMTKRLKEPGAVPAAKASAKPGANLSETDSDKDVLGGGTPGASQATVEQAVTHLAEIVGVLAADKLKKKRTSKLEAALDGISASGISDTMTLGSGKKAAAARRVLRSSLQESPEEVYQLIEKMMLEDLMHQTLTPGMPGVTLNCRAWMEHRSRIGPFKTGAYLGWTAAGALDCMIQGNTAGARARLALMLLMLDQCATDRGSWLLAAELSLEPPPPLVALSAHNPPSASSDEPPFSRILDARWAEVALSHLREAEDYAARRSKLGRGAVVTEEKPDPKGKAKAKAKSLATSESQ